VSLCEQSKTNFTLAETSEIQVIQQDAVGEVNYIILMHAHIKIIKFSSEFASLLYVHNNHNNLNNFIRFGYFNFPIILVLCS